MDLDLHLEKYANLIVRKGLNLQPGEKLLVRCNADGLPLVRHIAREAYKAGVLDLKLLFQDDQLALDRYLFAPEAAFEVYPEEEVTVTGITPQGQRVVLLKDGDWQI
jgi:aminopeptidase